ncbi:MAG: O-acetyl-ADP-ribose deacetylase [Phycisphaerales bacterium]|nr:O-acetyl-ADP-ribose deacetylase [Phycisphaerales bacterium]
MPLPRVTRADITTLRVDAIVNAANSTLRGGGGVDGAIHRAAGPGLLEECCRHPGCPAGHAILKGGYDLPARHVIHTVGPVYHGGQEGEAQVLAACYRACLAVVAEHDLQSVAFPCISTGVYGYPADEAAAIAFREVQAWLSSGGAAAVTFCCFSDDDVDHYRALIRDHAPHQSPDDADPDENDAQPVQ